MRVIPELNCTNIEVTKRFFIEVLGFEVKFERIEEKFAYFTRDDVDFMSEEANGPGRRWHTGKMELPFGRGINFMWEVKDTQALYDRVMKLAPENIYLEIECASYRVDNEIVQQKQFIVQDPDGYLFRFCDTLEAKK